MAAHKWTEEEKKIISEKRKKWLKENPEKHVWRKKTKFVSTPCELLKTFLRDSGIEFEEEAIVSEDRNYSVDILIPSKNLIIEVNGNQHYEKDGRLRPYYQERHDHISLLGWKVLEVHYTMAFNHKLIEKMINEEHLTSKVLPFKLKEKNETSKKIYGNHKLYGKARSENWIEENKKYIDLIKNSSIDFSKFGWVTKVSELINQKPQKVNSWMKKIMPDFYEEKCFKKKQ
jgi:very-short-patch-repair endonuclease